MIECDTYDNSKVISILPIVFKWFNNIHLYPFQFLNNE